MSQKSDNNKATIETYDASGIEFYQGTKAVRKRPTMYLGDVDSSKGLLNMITEIIDNSVDEHMSGHGNEIRITLHKDGFIEVDDDGRGIPVDRHSSGVSAFELVLTQLHAGGKFNRSAYKVSGGTHGLGMSAVIALSQKAVAQTRREGFIYTLNFFEGEKAGEITKESTDKRNGTTIKFLPDPSIFSVIDMDYDLLFKRLNEIAFLNPNLVFTINDQKYKNGSVTIHHPGGISEFLEKTTKDPIHPSIYIEGAGEEQHSKLFIKFLWQESSKENIKAFTNNISQDMGGTHVTGLRHAVSKVLLKHYNILVPKTHQVDVTGEDTRCGFNAILSLYLPDAKFSSQTKECLVSKEARTMVEKLVSKELEDWMSKHPQEAKKILMHITRCASMRINFEKKKELIENKKNDFGSIIHKFANCQSNDPNEKELIIVEGDSAGGSAKSGRDPKYQATLSIQGKLLNVKKATVAKFLESKEFVTLINVLNCGIGDDADLDKISFKKIIIMTDADVDGSHIRTLLLTFFFKYLPGAITRGYVYVGRPPLYKVSDRSHAEYIENNQKLKYYVYENFLSKIKCNDEFTIKDYLLLLEYRKLIQIYFSDINHLFISRLLMAGVLDILHNKTTIEQVEKNYFHTENVFFKINVQQIDEEGNMTIYLEYRSFYTKHTSTPVFSKDFINRISPILERITKFFKKKMTLLAKDGVQNFDEPLLLLNFLDEVMRNQVHIERYKGLGSMDPEQLWETSLDPKRRVIEQVFFDEESLAETAEIFEILLGEDVTARKNYLFEHYNYEEEEEEEREKEMQ